MVVLAEEVEENSPADFQVVEAESWRKVVALLLEVVEKGKQLGEEAGLLWVELGMLQEEMVGTKLEGAANLLMEDGQ